MLTFELLVLNFALVAPVHAGSPTVVARFTFTIPPGGSPPTMVLQTTKQKVR
jgi:hypothetical protein